jgi:hypothetical protein
MSQNTLSTRVIKLKSFFESLAEIMGFLAGFSFIARLMKYFLMSKKAIVKQLFLIQKKA